MRMPFILIPRCQLKMIQCLRLRAFLSHKRKRVSNFNDAVMTLPRLLAFFDMPIYECRSEYHPTKVFTSTPNTFHSIHFCGLRIKFSQSPVYSCEYN